MFATANEFGWWLGAVAVMPNHVHCILAVEGDPEPSTLLSRLKSYASRELNSKYGACNWWTRSGSTRKLPKIPDIQTAMRYIREQPGALAIYLDEIPGLNDLDE